MLPEFVLQQFPPDKTCLLDQIRKQISDPMLHVISLADYGFDASESLNALLPIRNKGILPERLGWHPCEVLELTRWTSIPGHESRYPEELGTEIKAHQNRLFACAVLLLATCDHQCQYEDSGIDRTLLIAMDSANFLGDEMNQAMAQFLSWQFSLCDSENKLIRPSILPLTCALGILYCALRLSKSLTLGETEWDQLLSWVLSEYFEGPGTKRFYGSGTYQQGSQFRYDIEVDDWDFLVTELQSYSQNSASVELQQKIELIMIMLS